MKITAISGDVGGQKALIPVLRLMEQREIDFFVIAHRGLEKFFPDKTVSASAGQNNSNHELPDDTDLVIFTTSVKDSFPLEFAKSAKEKGIPVACLLDNWMNYRKRLEVDGEMLIPDRYFIMDKKAFQGAVKDGIPKEILEITGHPALTDNIAELKVFCNNKTLKSSILRELGVAENKLLLLFVSEPAELDQGSDSSSPSFRGYTEKTVLQDLCTILQNHSSNICLALQPHPREDADALNKVWEDCRGKLPGGILKISGRQAVAAADGVCGMASILLYEAWLTGKPVISLQPDVLKEDLRQLFADRKGIITLLDNAGWDNKISEWLSMIGKNTEILENSDMQLHENAADNIIKSMKYVSGCTN